MHIKSPIGLAGFLALALSVVPGCVVSLADGACRCSDPPGYCIDGQDAKEVCAQFSYCHFDEGDTCLADILAGGPPT